MNRSLTLSSKVLINSTKSSWRPVARRVSQGSIVGPVLLNVIINGLDYEEECTLSNLAGDTKQGGVADTAEGCATIQRVIDGLEMGRQELQAVEQREM